MLHEGMNYHYFIGLDCSKAKLDYALINAAGQVLTQGKVDNQHRKIVAWMSGLLADYDCQADQVLLCAENTGLYSNRLKVVATDKDYTLWCQDALELKLRSGKQKSKTDAADALLIARYARRYADQAVPYQMPEADTLRLKQISRQRTTLLQDVTAWKVRLNEQLDFGLIAMDKTVRRLLKKHIRQAEKIIAELDTILFDLIKANDAAKRIYDLTISVPGFGPKNTITMLAETEFYDKTPTGKACASYAGLCPHKYESGSSVKRRARTSKACNKRLKSALHLGAMSLIKHDNIYRSLYDRLRNKKRLHLQAINAVRNKMVTVLFACLRDDTMYQKNLHGSLQVP